MKYEVEIEFHKDFVQVEGNKITVGIHSRPEKGKANTELVKKLAKYFDVSSSQVRIIAGLRSRKKIVMIDVT